MDKNDLKLKWSKYCDTDKLVDEVIAMYTDYGHTCSIYGVCTMLDEFFKNKEHLIEIIMKSKNYIGDLRIAVQRDFDRQISANEVKGFFYNNGSHLRADHLFEYKDADGKSFFDYLATGKKTITIDELPNAEEQTEKRKFTRRFNSATLATLSSCNKVDAFNYFMECFRYTNTSKLTCDIEASCDETAPKFTKGTKTSRAFNAVCCHYGVDKLNPQTVDTIDANGNLTSKTVYPYNKLFAAYSDLVSDITRKMYFVVSLNPLDYLTMSNGVSWKSCHNIYDGCYKGGVLSYMLDNSSFITFVVNELKDPIYKTPKFYRQMFHYSDGMFMQNRLYPQGNDGAVDLYTKFRNFMIEEFSELLNSGNEWEVEVGARTCKRRTISYGRHYRDYLSNDRCNIFYPIASRDKAARNSIVIGHDGICARCGKPYSADGRLSHRFNDDECVID